MAQSAGHCKAGPPKMRAAKHETNAGKQGAVKKDKIGVRGGGSLTKTM